MIKKMMPRQAIQGWEMGLKKLQRGVTLIESAMVISVISLIILAALLALEAVTEQRRLTQVVTDVANIRSAISKWAGGGMVVYPGEDDGAGGLTARIIGADFEEWDQIAGLLPGHLGVIADGTETAILVRANPWSFDYSFVTQEAGGNVWCLGIQGVPSDLALVLIKQLLLNGAQNAGNARQSGICFPATGTPGFTSGGTAGTDVDIVARYEE